jgi:LmbE family N-acetylglucosaminyl deacetylase
MLNLTFSKATTATFRVLCLGAHSDDIEIGCGGALLQLLNEFKQVTVHWVVFSANDERKVEAETSAAKFLAHAAEKVVVVRNHRDGYFPYFGAAIKDDFESLKGECQPDLVFTHYREDRHQDHRMISDLTWNTFRSHLILEYEIPKYDGDVGQPNFFVPLSESICQSKAQLLMTCFRSQIQRQWFNEQTFMSILRMRGMEAHSPTCYAEGFYCRKVVLG